MPTKSSPEFFYQGSKKKVIMILFESYASKFFILTIFANLMQCK
jgi:hypothetical protein